MTTRATAILSTLIVLMTACSLPASAPTLSVHDLGGSFPAATAKSAVPLRAVQVGAQPVVATTGMLYREASQPTRRGSYALNRWAAPPATLVEAAMTRMLGLDGTARCRLQMTLAEFIVDVDAAGKAKAILSADATLYRDGQVPIAQRSFDIDVPMREAAPATGALALREAVQRLGQGTAEWLGGDSARACRA